MISEAFVLAGGKSTRMGTPKALLEIDGVNFLTKTLQTLSESAERVFIVGTPPSPEKFSDWEIVDDELPGEGILSGLYTGLKACKTAWAFCGCCDVPTVHKDLPGMLWEVADGKTDCLMPHALGFPQPTLSLYRTSIHKDVPKYLDRTTESNLRRKLWGFLDRIKVQLVEESHFTSRGIPKICFHNNNDVHDLDFLMQEWGKMK